MTKLILVLLLSGCANRIYAVNDQINSYKYAADKVDYMKTPTQFYADGGGDCEDFANAKKEILGGELVMLQRLFVQDNKLVTHVVLKVDGFLLDNRTGHIKLASTVKTIPYNPKYNKES